MLKIRRDDFNRVLRLINDSKSRKDIIPILNYVFFQFTGSSLIVKSTDLAISVQCNLAAEGSIEPTTFALPLTQLNNVLQFTKTDLMIEGQGNSIVFKGDTKYKLNTGDAKLFPSIDFSLPSKVSAHTGAEMRKLLTYCIGDGFLKPLTLNSKRYAVIADKMFNFSLILPIGDLLDLDLLIPARALKLAALWGKDEVVSYGVKDNCLLMHDSSLSTIIKVQTESNQFEGAMGSILSFSQKSPLLQFEITSEFLTFMENASVFNRNTEDIRDVFFVVDPNRQSVGLYTESEYGVMSEILQTRVKAYTSEVKTLCVSLSRIKTLEFFAPKDNIGMIDNGKMLLFSENLFSLVALKNSPSVAARAEAVYSASLKNETPLFTEVSDAAN